MAIVAKIEAYQKRMQDAAKAETRLTRRSRGLFVIQISQMVNDLDLFLDEFEVQDDKRNRRRLLERSVLLSIRGLNVLVEEPFMGSTNEYFETMRARLNDNGRQCGKSIATIRPR